MISKENKQSRIAFALALTTISITLSSCAASPNVDSSTIKMQSKSTDEKINALNKATIQSLNISLNALALLLDASPNSYYPMWHLKRSGDIQYIRELEKEGYVEVTISKGYPDGQSPNEEVLRMVPLAPGIEIQQSIKRLKPNKSL